MTHETLEDPSAQREALQKLVLEQSQLEYCHERYPGAVRLILVRRTSAVLRIRDRQVRFHLPEEDHGHVELTAEGALSTLKFKQSHPALWGLALHIAAEAMLALRNGHKEHVRVRKRKKAATADV